MPDPHEEMIHALKGDEPPSEIVRLEDAMKAAFEHHMQGRQYGESQTNHVRAWFNLGFAAGASYATERIKAARAS